MLFLVLESTKRELQPKGIPDDHFHLFGPKNAEKCPFAMAIPEKSIGFPQQKTVLSQFAKKCSASKGLCLAALCPKSKGIRGYLLVECC